MYKNGPRSLGRGHQSGPSSPFFIFYEWSELERVTGESGWAERKSGPRSLDRDHQSGQRSLGRDHRGPRSHVSDDVTAGPLVDAACPISGSSYSWSH